MAINLENNRSRVRITEDGLSAFLSLAPPDENEKYEQRDVLDILSKNEITEGILGNTIKNLLQYNNYSVEILIAQGKPAQDGKDGNYIFLFDVVRDNKPKVLPDGSVDYSSMRDVSTVEEGEEIVRYIPAVQGCNGIDVKGRPILAKAGRELTPLKGKGFVASPDKLSYKALTTGKVEFENERLLVTNMITIEGDVNLITGNIEFAGDVLVHGNVITGMSIHAKGNITVDGHVEGSQLIAGKDVSLKNGMQGGGRGEIRAGGAVCGKFFEQTTIYAKGNISANAILNCHIMSEKEIIVTGKKGIIVGGTTSAIMRIEATIIGNMSEVKTKIDLGVDNEIYSHIMKVKEKYENTLCEINKIEEAIAKLNKILEKSDRPEIAEKKLQLLRFKIAKDSVIASLQTEMKLTKTKVDNSVGAKLIVRKSIYRGTKIDINGVQKIIESENYNVYYQKEENEMVCKQNF